MPRRTVWFTAGVVAGAAATVYGWVRAREAVDRASVEHAADVAVDAARRVGRVARDTVVEVRASVAEVDAELRAAHGPGRRRGPAVVHPLPGAGSGSGAGRRGR